MMKTNVSAFENNKPVIAISTEIPDKFTSNILGIKKVNEPKINPPANVVMVSEIKTIFHPSTRPFDVFCLVFSSLISISLKPLN